MAQPNLFDVPAAPRVPYAPGSATSKAAAEKARGFIGEQGERVAAWFEAQGVHGATQKQASEALHIGRASMCARVNALERDGRLVKTARRFEGCAVYRVTEKESSR